MVLKHRTSQNDRQHPNYIINDRFGVLADYPTELGLSVGQCSASTTITRSDDWRGQARGGRTCEL